MSDWLFDRTAYQLIDGSTRLQLTPKAAAVLDFLISHKGEVVSREDVLQSVWTGLHVTPGLVREYVFDLRNALGDDAKSPRFIETVRGRGFRYLGGISYRMAEEAKSDTARPAETRATIAVLRPETDMASERLADGVASDIINELGRFRDLFAIARTSSFAVDMAQDVRDIARSLGADYLLECSFYQSGERTKVRFQLIDGQTGHFVWSERLSYASADPGTLRDEIVETVIPVLSGWHGAVHVAMHKSVAHRDSDSLNAFEHYIRACDINLVLDEPGLRRSIHHLNRSLELDPRFARCWAMKSAMLKWAYDVYRAPDPDMLQEAAEAIEMAYTLEPNDPANLGLVALLWAAKGDFARAEAAVRQAEATAGSDTDACIATATPLALVLADFPAARAMLDQAFPPNCPVPGYFRIVEARIAFFIDEFDRSIAASRQGFRHVSGLAFRALSQAMTDAKVEAQETLAKIEAEFPQFDFDRFARTLPITHQDARAKYDRAWTRLKNLPLR